MLHFNKVLIAIFFTLSISPFTLALAAQEDETEENQSADEEIQKIPENSQVNLPKGKSDCEDRNSLANLRGECSDYIFNAGPVVEVDVRGIPSDQVAIKIHEAVKKIAQEKSYAQQSNEMLNAEKSLKIVYNNQAGESRSTLLVGAGLTKLVERDDLKKHIVAGAISAEIGAIGFKKILALSGYKVRNDFAERLAGLATACFVGVAKEAYDSRFPQKHTVDKKDAFATCAGGAGILLKSEFKF